MDPLDLTGPVAEVAQALLGAQVTRAGVTVRLTEVEAYAGEGDPASHAARGPTPRNAPMYGPPGHWYVYFVYGMHWCANVVAGPEGTASAVLLRGAEVTAGHDLARVRRPGRGERDLARGPAALARVLDLTGAASTEPVAVWPGSAGGLADRLAGGSAVPSSSGPRTGIRVGADTPWRFWLPGEPGVSAYRLASRRRGAGGSEP